MTASTGIRRAYDQEIKRPDRRRQHQVSRNSLKSPDVNDRDAQGGADRGPKDVHFRQIADSAHPLQEGSLAAREGDEKEDYGEQPNIKGVVSVPECEPTDLLAREKESRGTDQSRAPDIPGVA